MQNAWIFKRPPSRAICAKFPPADTGEFPRTDHFLAPPRNPKKNVHSKQKFTSEWVDTNTALLLCTFQTWFFIKKLKNYNMHLQNPLYYFWMPHRYTSFQGFVSTANLFGFPNIYVSTFSKFLPCAIFQNQPNTRKFGNKANGISKMKVFLIFKMFSHFSNFQFRTYFKCYEHYLT